MSFDLLIIGGGPGGYVCAIRASQLGLKVGLVDKNKRLGGTCLNVGCIPSKALLHSTEIFHQIQKDASSHGVICPNLELDLGKMMKRKSQVVDQLGKGVRTLVSKKGVEIFQGSAKVLGNENSCPMGLQIRNCRLEIVLATGSSPVELPSMPFDGTHIVNSDQAIAFDQVPAELIVVGAGAIGLEMACVWSRLGAKVTIVEFLDEICPQLDPEVARITRKIFEKQGIHFILSSKVENSQINNGRVYLTVSNNAGQTELSADRVLVAVGRKPYSQDLGIEDLDIETDEKGRVKVNNYFQTNVSGIRAIGDLIHGPMLAHKAEEDGVACAEILAGQAGHVDYSMVPGVIYTEPEVANLGISESQAKEHGINVCCGSFPLSGNGRAIATNSTDGIVKLVADAHTDRLLGAQIVAHGAKMIASW